MNPEVATAFDELAARGLVSRPWRVEELGGNRDRKPERARWHFLVHPAKRPSLKLTIGRALAQPHARSRAFAAAMPRLSPREVFFVRVGTMQAWATEAIDGRVLEELATDGAAAARFLGALEAIERELETTAENSTASAFDEEWQGFFASLIRLSCWSSEERRFLEHQLLPTLRARLKSTSLRTRWTNGDFTSSNLGLTGEQRVVAFDAEYSARTHFFGEDRVRFRRISRTCAEHPGLVAGWWPTPTPEWEVFFQLRQLVLEHAENSAAYNATATPARQAVVRFLGSDWTEAFPAEWPEPLPPEPGFPCETTQLFWRTAEEEFSEHRSVRVRIRRGVRQLAGFRLPGEFPFWRLDPVASKSRVVLHSLTAVIVAADGQMSGRTITQLRSEGARAERTSSGFVIEPIGADPQIHFSVPPDARGLVAELQCDG